ncbi:Fic family protein [Sebaldella sp. S0638]|uniref:Fic/DOC family protein n=1 Tax=Sebaldella sp. S0638 TaxID=2957809 RepID=UPI00209D2C71|nr:Fic family protein [Sebaldella sp. S0638]MCP1225756.1 Fic family protein [Sebaldella sp. S0638]
MDIDVYDIYMSDGEDYIYCYQGTKVLKNILDIKNSNVLKSMENKLVTTNQIILLSRPITDLSENGFKKIHNFLFKDIYKFAGKYRNVNISKGSTNFCRHEYINTQMKEIFQKLKNDNYLKNLPKNEFIKKITDFFADINAIHPFREGNGRALREYIRILALESGYRINLEEFCELNIDDYVEACIVSIYANEELLEKLFGKLFADV